MLDLKVNRNLLPMKGHLFLWSAGVNVILLFMPVYAGQLGFSSFIVGIVFTVLPFSGVLASLTMGSVADKFKCQKVIFLAAQFLAAAAFFSMIFLPEVPATTRTDSAGHSSQVVLETWNRGGTDVLKRLRSEVSDKEVLCHLNCLLNPRAQEIVCKYWRNDGCCGSHPENLRFSASAVTNFDQPTGDYIYFRVTDVTFRNSDVKDRSQLHHCKLLVNCDRRSSSHETSDLAVPALDEMHIVSQYQFWLLLITYLIAWMCKTVAVSLGDAICFQVLEGKPHRYGYQMLWGALGSGIFSMIVGFLVDGSSDDETKKNYTPAFLMVVGTVLLSIIVSYMIQFTQQHTSSSIIKDMGRLLASFRIIVFMSWCVCVGLCTGLSWNFLFWLLEDLSANQGRDIQSRIKTIEGLVVGAQCFAGDLPFFLLSGWIFKRIGHVQSMNLVLLVIGVKFVLYSLVVNPWWSIAVELLHGPTFGLLYATMVSYASIVAPLGTEATTQALVSAAFEGIGVSLGSFLGGVLFEEFGGSMAFRIVGISALVACAAHACVQYLLEIKTYKSNDT